MVSLFKNFSKLNIFLICLFVFLTAGAAVLAAECPFPRQGSITLSSCVISSGSTVGIDQGNIVIPSGATLQMSSNTKLIFEPGYSITVNGYIAKSSRTAIIQKQPYALPCTDECTSGQRRCSGFSSYQVCVSNYDPDPCYEWGSSTSCSMGYTCSGGNCISSCQCSSGVCCDGCNYRSSSYTCNSSYSSGYACRFGYDCGQDPWHWHTVKYCSGSSSSCDGSTSGTIWDSVSEDCNSSEKCSGGSPTCVACGGTTCQDSDGDGYRAQSCGGTDCCDSDARAYPGANGWYASTNNCGSWDYNCSGSTEKHYGLCTSYCNSSHCNEWRTSLPYTSDVSCGSSGRITFCACDAMPPYCKNSGNSQTQECH